MTKKRFIAGATCPSCQQQDVLTVIELDDGKQFDCVECGHSELLTEESSSNTDSAEQQARSGEALIQTIKID